MSNVASSLRKCFLCPTRTSTSICAHCAEDLAALDAPLPDPDADDTALRAWASANKITAFSCGAADVDPRGLDEPYPWESPR